MHIHSWPASILRVGRTGGAFSPPCRHASSITSSLPPPPYPHLSSPSLFPSSDPILGRRRRGGEGTTLESGCLLPSFLLSSPSRGDQRADDPPKEDEEAAKAARDIPPPPSPFSLSGLLLRHSQLEPFSSTLSTMAAATISSAPPSLVPKKGKEGGGLGGIGKGEDSLPLHTTARPSRANDCYGCVLT